MRKTKTVVVAVVASVMYCLSLSAAIAKDEAVKVEIAPKAKAEAVKIGTTPKVKNDAGKINNASKLFKEITTIPRIKIPPLLMSGANAIIVVPGATKNDFMVKGGSAGGLLLTHDKEGKWSSPVFITLSGGTLGWQIVSTPMDIILVFKNRKGVDAIMKGKFNLNAKTAVEPGWLGLNMKGAPAKVLKAEIATYVRSHGRFAEDAVVAGTTVQIDAAANDAFYAKPKVDAADILSGKVIKASEDVKLLQKLLTDYAAIK